jgi:broad specificity phosphatase PhoE
MAPQTLLVMRHAEKPADESDPHLSPAGLARAETLPGRVRLLIGGMVDCVFAAKESSHSDRPVETVTPLARAAGVDIDTDFRDKDYGMLAGQVLAQTKYDGRRIVVCWHHDNLPGFARALGAPVGTYPDPWPSQVFDLILVFSWNGSTLSVTRSRGR